MSFNSIFLCFFVVLLYLTCRRGDHPELQGREERLKRAQSRRDEGINRQAKYRVRKHAHLSNVIVARSYRSVSVCYCESSISTSSGFPAPSRAVPCDVVCLRAPVDDLTDSSFSIAHTLVCSCMSSHGYRKKTVSW